MGKLCSKNVIVRILTLQKAHAYFISKIKWRNHTSDTQRLINYFKSGKEYSKYIFSLHNISPWFTYLIYTTLWSLRYFRIIV